MAWSGGFDSRLLYLLLVLLIVAARLLELRRARRNERRLRARGAVEAGAGHYPVMVVLHGAFLASCLLEVFLLDRPLIPALAVAMLLLLIVAMALRYRVITTLGGRWTTRVLVVPGEKVVTAGPYRWLRHPNYLAVMVEILALPLVHTAWLTAAVFTVANALLLRVRIATEERALAGATDYGQRFGTRSPGAPEPRPEEVRQ